MFIHMDDKAPFLDRETALRAELKRVSGIVDILSAEMRAMRRHLVRVAPQLTDTEEEFAALRQRLNRLENRLGAPR
ncbi:MAG: hypothetical protein AAFQ84_09575 [Pseudomonadota bacterium]